MSEVFYAIRLARANDVPALPQIERAASQMYRSSPCELGIPEEVYAQTTPLEAFEAAQRDGSLWVASLSLGEPIGFALVKDVSGYAHLDELDVLPAYGRRGIGTALLAVVCSWARASGYPAVSLRTFRDVPWNAPFYEARGFRIVASETLSAGHVHLEDKERARGLRTDIRVTMTYDTVANVQ